MPNVFTYVGATSWNTFNHGTSDNAFLDKAVTAGNQLLMIVVVDEWGGDIASIGDDMSGYAPNWTELCRFFVDGGNQTVRVFKRNAVNESTATIDVGVFKGSTDIGISAAILETTAWPAGTTVTLGTVASGTGTTFSASVTYTATGAFVLGITSPAKSGGNAGFSGATGTEIIAAGDATHGVVEAQYEFADGVGSPVSLSVGYGASKTWDMRVIAIYPGSTGPILNSTTAQVLTATTILVGINPNGAAVTLDKSKITFGGHSSEGGFTVASWTIGSQTTGNLTSTITITGGVIPPGITAAIALGASWGGTTLGTAGGVSSFSVPNNNTVAEAIAVTWLDVTASGIQDWNASASTWTIAPYLVSDGEEIVEIVNGSVGTFTSLIADDVLQVGVLADDLVTMMSLSNTQSFIGNDIQVDTLPPASVGTPITLDYALAYDAAGGTITLSGTGFSYTAPIIIPSGTLGTFTFTPTVAGPISIPFSAVDALGIAILPDNSPMELIAIPPSDPNLAQSIFYYLENHNRTFSTRVFQTASDHLVVAAQASVDVVFQTTGAGAFSPSPLHALGGQYQLVSYTPTKITTPSFKHFISIVPNGNQVYFEGISTPTRPGSPLPSPYPECIVSGVSIISVVQLTSTSVRVTTSAAIDVTAFDLTWLQDFSSSQAVSQRPYRHSSALIQVVSPTVSDWTVDNTGGAFALGHQVGQQVDSANLPTPQPGLTDDRVFITDGSSITVNASGNPTRLLHHAWHPWLAR